MEFEWRVNMNLSGYAGNGEIPISDVQKKKITTDNQKGKIKWIFLKKQENSEK